MDARRLEVPLSPVFRWNAAFPLLAQLIVAAIATALAWMLLSEAYTERHGRILSGWSFDVAQVDDADRSGPATLLHAQDEPTDALSWMHLPANEASSFGRLALNLEFPATLSFGDAVSATRRVCADEGQQIVFYVSTPFKRMAMSGAFVLHLVQDGRELWTLPLPAAPQPMVYRVPLAGGRCSQVQFKLTTRVGVKSASWRRASKTEIVFPRLERVSQGDPGSARASAGTPAAG